MYSSDQISVDINYLIHTSMKYSVTETTTKSFNKMLLSHVWYPWKVVYAIFDEDESPHVPIWNAFDNKVNSTEGLTVCVKQQQTQITTNTGE